MLMVLTTAIQFADWWTDMAYLGYRSPLPVWSSPGFVLPPQQFANNEYKWLAYAAKLISGALDYKTKLDEGTIPVELNGQQPMDMIQYFRLFGATRQPGEVKDQAKVCNNSRFAIVAHRGNVSRHVAWIRRFVHALFFSF
jgi:carnitine O-acetyltransferase